MNKIKKKIAVLRFICSNNIERQKTRLVSVADLLKTGGKLKRRKIEESKLDDSMQIKIPFKLLELTHNPVINVQKKTALVTVRRKWDFLQLFDLILREK